MGEAKNRQNTAPSPVWVIDPADDRLLRARMLAKDLMELAGELNASFGERQLSTGLSLAIQILVQGSTRKFNRNDLLNGLAKAQAWALHPMRELERIAALASMAEQTMVMARDSERPTSFSGMAPKGSA